MGRKKIIIVAGARPNFMKIAPICERIKEKKSLFPKLVHTGQHYDPKMSKVFFEDLGIPSPDINMEIGSCSHAVQTAKIMEGFEKILISEKPDLTLVVGDVNSTIACALTSVKMGISVGHVEAGLRSFDRSMPEEINRVLTDSISEILFTTEPSGKVNLLKEGIPSGKIFFVGNPMIDSLFEHWETAKKSCILEKMKLNEKEFGLITLHRPSNVDHREKFGGILKGLQQVSKKIPLIFPCHPRTLKNIQLFEINGFVNGSGKGAHHSGITLIEPLGYIDFLKIMGAARIVFTDSGGIQEETTILGVPCLTLRDNTERPITISEGTNKLISSDANSIELESLKVLETPFSHSPKIELWDGKAGKRIVDILENILCP